MATQTTAPAAATASPKLQRTDTWWVAPLAFLALFSAFGLWATVRAFQNAYYDTELLAQQIPGLFSGSIPHYLSPFYSPTINLNFKIGGFAISPALLILPFPLSFRLSCYYYRKMIYRSYLADPIACAVSEPKPLDAMRRKKYTGERAFPFIAQNFHRFAFYAAAVFIVLLWIDTVKAFFFTDPNSLSSHFGIALGSLVFLANICLLSLYTFSCHSWRHLVGGGQDCYSCSVMNKTRFGMWQKVSFLNERHGLWAMMSLCSVALTDVYVYLVSTHPNIDFHFFG